MVNDKLKIILGYIQDNKPTLHTLNLSNMILPMSAFEDILSALAHNTHVIYLNFENTKIGEHLSSMLSDFLSKNQMIKILDLTNCDLDDKSMKKILTSLINNKKLEVLNLTANRLHEDNFKTLIELLDKNENISVLGLENCEFMNEHNANLLAETINKRRIVDHLDLAKNAMSLSMVKPFADIKVLKYLNLSANGLLISKVLPLFEDNVSIQHLVLSNNNMDEIGFKSLKQFLEKNDTLEVLDLLDVGLNQHDVDEITRVLEEARNKKLHTINIKEDMLDVSSIEKLERVLQHRKKDNQ